MICDLTKIKSYCTSHQSPSTNEQRVSVELDKNQSFSVQRLLMDMENEVWYSSDLREVPSFASSSNKSSFQVWPPLPQASSSTGFQFSSFSIPTEEVGDERGVSASKSHSLAEKRRRERINSHLVTLRKLIPESDKMDKAALLGSVIDHVKDLKSKAVEVRKATTVPTDNDELTIDCEIGQVDQDKKEFFIKASLCCDDRPELFSEIIRALKGQRLRAVKADMASVGGRIKSILVLCTMDDDEGICLNTLQQSLKLVLSSIAFPSLQSNFRIRNKGHRFFQPSHVSV